MTEVFVEQPLHWLCPGLLNISHRQDEGKSNAIWRRTSWDMFSWILLHDRYFHDLPHISYNLFWCILDKLRANILWPLLVYWDTINLLFYKHWTFICHLIRKRTHQLKEPHMRKATWHWEEMFSPEAITQLKAIYSKFAHSKYGTTFLSPRFRRNFLVGIFTSQFCWRVGFKF